jgi:hypothetical protein
MLHNKKAPSLTDSPNIDNPNIEFFCPVYRDFLLVDRLSKQVQALYPNHTFVVISDGLIPATAESDRLRTNLGSRNHTLIETSDRLKLIEFGGAWLERLYQIVLTQTTAERLVRLEGDTCLWRKFKQFPNAPIAGTINQISGNLPPFPRGGCIYFERDCLRAILDSGQLRNLDYRNNPEFGYPRYSSPLFRSPQDPYEPGLVLCSDRLQAHALAQLGITPQTWPEVLIFGSKQTDLIARSHDYAATHPHPELN